MKEVGNDILPWQELLKSLSAREQRKALRGGVRRCATKVRKAAVTAAKGSGLTMPAGMEKGIRVWMYGKALGFMVTSIPHKKKGYWKNRQGKEKPVVMWAAEGTRYRYRGAKWRVNRRTGKAGWKKHSIFGTMKPTGQMRAYGFMEKAEAALSTVEKDIFQEIENNVRKVAAKINA